MTTIYGDLRCDGDQWAYIALRLSYVLSVKDDETLESELLQMKSEDEDMFNKMLDWLLDGEEHFRRYSEMMRIVLSRTSFVLEQAGHHPD